ncbi:MAG: O-antigen ligase domain-containing protein [Anaerolineae bacterium]|nr:MAG: O-antigen ligase domain-containing protein [Anaerolineae bacterium]
MSKLISTARLEGLARGLWRLLLLSLPITSFRYFPAVMGATQHQPLALYFLALFLPLSLWLVWRRGGLRLPRPAVPLLAFVLFALAASLIAVLYMPLPLRGAEVEGRILRGWVSFGLGLAFLAGATLGSQLEGDLRPSLRWLYAGLAATILWGLVQAAAIHTPFVSHDWVDEIQLSFSLRRLLDRRISGFAYEPSWLADQIVLLYLPWLAAAVLRREPATRFRWLEPGLLAGGVVLVLLSYSRSGLLTGLAAIAGGLLLTGGPALRRVAGWFSQPFQRPGASERGLRLGVLMLLVAALGVSVFWLAQNRYITRLVQFNTELSLNQYLINIGGGPRVAAAIAAFGTFDEHPLTGVGLGASGLYLMNHYPDWVMTNVQEVARLFAPDSPVIPNPKNLYTRLLAETGLPGLWLWLAFMLAVLSQVRALLRRPESAARFVGTAGIFFWLALMLRNITQDSLTFPIMWVNLGLLFGAALRLENEPLEKTINEGRG